MPFQEEIGESESGNGYALRLSEINDVNFHDLASRIASVGHCYVPSAAARWVAYVYGTSYERLLARLPSRRRQKGETVVDFFGHTLSRPYFVRTTRPQICSVCLDERLPCSITWELSLVTECSRHRVQLTDQCGQCGRRISWRRPGLSLCICGSDFREQPVLPSVDVSASISILCESLMLRRTPAHSLPAWFVPLRELSLDTFSHCVYAVAHNFFDRSSWSRLLPTAEARVLAIKACDALMLAHSGQPISLPKARTVAFRSALEQSSSLERKRIGLYFSRSLFSELDRLSPLRVQLEFGF
ncbi:TniQ family protein [Achromobacter mucicolens]|uniref:TniQ family protein n=1 Tax=Achromobacter mucicolens TaxID=1389922 RepID=UPI003C7C549E